MMIKVEEPDDEDEEREETQIEMNWIDEYSQESLLSPMPSTSKGRRGRPRKEKVESDSLNSLNESADDQRIRDTVNTNCDYCCEDLINFKDAKIHYKEMHGVEGFFICCGRKFKQKCRLIDHVNSHYDLAYSCTFCEKGFNSRSYLMKHMACHEVDKQFVRF